ncbi:MAG: hybrid sensor histidine kinase/response regulator [Magnetococcales bacterium]|nr:hybrid sensor histidine kinase/response regulator [Magnetococcales bacterium]
MEEQKATILIVDDVPGNIKMLIASLGEEYRLLVARNGRDALTIVEQQPVDLILLDVVMPGIDGHEVCRQLQENETTKEIPIIFVTAKGEIADETHALALGAVDFLTKPVSPPIVKARVTTHLGLKLARESLKKQNQALQEAARLREDVDRIMRHDLKSPLNAVIGFASLLNNSLEKNSEQAAQAQMVLDSAYTLLGMINLSLDLFKIERGIYELKAREVNLLDLIHKIKGANKRALQVKQLTWQVLINTQPVEEGERFLVLGEELLCFSMLGNLLKNAVEASPRQQTITIRLQQQGLFGEIAIHNQGAIPGEIREHFFSKYTTSGKEHGTGLGAYSARLMATAQRGSIEVESSPEAGTTLIIRLPSATPAAPGIES